MKITDYQRVTSLLDNDIFLVDGVNGTKTIKTSDLTKEIDRRGNIWDTLDDYIPVELRRNIWRGKNLGSEPPGESVYDEIGDGTFKGLYLGDYWSIGNNIYRIVDFNYWIGTGDIECTTNHLVIMPDRVIYNSKMNDTNSASGGYVNSKMRTEGLNQAKTIVGTLFGETHVLNHRELLTNSVTNGYPSSGSWYDSNVELPNEIMMYGAYILAPGGNGTIIPYRYTVDKAQLAAMKAHPKMVNPARENIWLRDMLSADAFVAVSDGGNPYAYNASYAIGVRVVFGIKKSS